MRWKFLGRFRGKRSIQLSRIPSQNAVTIQNGAKGDFSVLSSLHWNLNKPINQWLFAHVANSHLYVFAFIMHGATSLITRIRGWTLCSTFHFVSHFTSCKTGSLFTIKKRVREKDRTQTSFRKHLKMLRRDSEKLNPTSCSRQQWIIDAQLNKGICMIMAKILQAGVPFFRALRLHNLLQPIKHAQWIITPTDV